MFCLNIYGWSTPAYGLPHSDLPIKNIMYVCMYDVCLSYDVIRLHRYFPHETLCARTFETYKVRPGGTSLHKLYRYVPPDGVLILELLIEDWALLRQYNELQTRQDV